MSSFSASVSIEVAAPRLRTFETIVPIDLPSIFPGYGPLPAVSGTRNQTGAWNAAGQTRTVLLSDGSSANEMLTAYEHPLHFAYTVNAFTGVLGPLAKEAHGAWWFKEGASAGSTRVDWSYTFVARSAWSAPLVWFIARFLWRGYMHKALRLSRIQVERHIA